MKRQSILSSACIIAGLILSSQTAVAAEKGGRFAIEGVGIVKCRDYVAALRGNSQQKFLFAGYIQGYLTARNELDKTVFDMTPWQDINTLGDYLVNYCEANPTVAFGGAVKGMLAGLYGQRLAEYSEPKKVKIGENEYILYQATIVRMQKRLAQLNFYKGKADGNYNAQTIAAVKAFQKANKMTADGTPSQITMHKLFMVK